MPPTETMPVRVSTFAREHAFELRLNGEISRLINMPRDTKTDGILRIMLATHGELNSFSRTEEGEALIKVLCHATNAWYSHQSILDLLDSFKSDIHRLLDYCCHVGRVGMKLLKGHGIEPCVVRNDDERLVELPDTFKIMTAPGNEVLAHVILKPSKSQPGKKPPAVSSLVIPAELKKDSEQEGPSEGGYVFYLSITLEENGEITYTPSHWDRASAWPQDSQVMQDLYFRTLKVMILLTMAGSVLRRMGWDFQSARTA